MMHLLPYLLAALLVLEQFGDWFTTARARATGTIESNAILDVLIRELGFSEAMLIKVVFISGIAIAATQLPYGWVPLAIGVVLYVWVIWHNWRLVK